jgi:hypothetical protein
MNTIACVYLSASARSVATEPNAGAELQHTHLGGHGVEVEPAPAGGNRGDQAFLNEGPVSHGPDVVLVLGPLAAVADAAVPYEGGGGLDQEHEAPRSRRLASEQAAAVRDQALLHREMRQLDLLEALSIQQVRGRVIVD